MQLEFDDAEHDHAPARTIALIGLRGSGKTTVGRRLASRLALPFIDLDTRTPGFAGEASVAEVFAKQGEAAFRRAETRALDAALREPASVLALGGGTPTAPGAAEALRRARDAGTVIIVYLRADGAALRSRLANASHEHRPSLTGKGTLDEIEHLLAARDPLYLSLATHVVEVAASDASRVALFIAAKLM